MQMHVQVNTILQETARLPLEDQEFLVETMLNRLRELRRNQIASRALEAEENYRKGDVQRGTLEDLMNSLETDDD